jgi:hypothetical protein
MPIRRVIVYQTLGSGGEAHLFKYLQCVPAPGA